MALETDPGLSQRMQRDLADSYDEELELELDDRDLDPETLLPPPARAASSSVSHSA